MEQDERAFWWDSREEVRNPSVRDSRVVVRNPKDRVAVGNPYGEARARWYDSSSCFRFARGFGEDRNRPARSSWNEDPRGISFDSMSNLRAKFTIHVDNLPNRCEIPWFKKFFSQFGEIINAFLPFNRSRKTGNRFGIVRFIDPINVDKAIAATDGLFCGKNYLRVRRASFDRKVVTRVANSRNATSGGFGHEDGFNYDDSVHSDPPGFLMPGEFRSVRSKQFNQVSLKLQPSGAGWLCTSSVAKLISVSTPDILRKAFAKLGFKNVRVRSMGGMEVIITFQSKEERIEAHKHSNVLKWFSFFRPWNGEVSGYSRLVWLKCRGLPLNVWNQNSFKKIGELWGQFISLDSETLFEEAFDVARMLIATDVSYRIDDQINVLVNGNKYIVKAWEENCDDPFNEKHTRAWIEQNMVDPYDVSRDPKDKQVRVDEVVNDVSQDQPIPEIEVGNKVGENVSVSNVLIIGDGSNAALGPKAAIFKMGTDLPNEQHLLEGEEPDPPFDVPKIFSPIPRAAVASPIYGAVSPRNFLLVEGEGSGSGDNGHLLLQNNNEEVVVLETEQSSNHNSFSEVQGPQLKSIEEGEVVSTDSDSDVPETIPSEVQLQQSTKARDMKRREITDFLVGGSNICKVLGKGQMTADLENNLEQSDSNLVRVNLRYTKEARTKKKRRELAEILDVGKEICQSQLDGYRRYNSPRTHSENSDSVNSEGIRNRNTLIWNNLKDAVSNVQKKVDIPDEQKKQAISIVQMTRKLGVVYKENDEEAAKKILQINGVELHNSFSILDRKSR